jgi:hypothetical protein
MLQRVFQLLPSQEVDKVLKKLFSLRWLKEVLENGQLSVLLVLLMETTPPSLYQDSEDLPSFQV